MIWIKVRFRAADRPALQDQAGGAARTREEISETVVIAGVDPAVSRPHRAGLVIWIAIVAVVPVGIAACPGVTRTPPPASSSPITVIPSPPLAGRGYATVADTRIAKGSSAIADTAIRKGSSPIAQSAVAKGGTAIADCRAPQSKTSAANSTETDTGTVEAPNPAVKAAFSCSTRVFLLMIRSWLGNPDLSPAYWTFRISTPGNDLPSSHSRKAPPAVEA